MFYTNTRPPPPPPPPPLFTCRYPHLCPYASRPCLVPEQALGGSSPEDPITASLLESMPELHAFALETLRLAPPARSNRLRLEAPLELEGGLILSEGSIIAPDPFVNGLLPSQHASPETFDPERFMGEAPEPSPLAAAFGGKLGGEESEAGKALALTFAKASFVQARRMFEVTLPLDRPPTPSGYPIHAIGENVEAFCDPGMYYELKRGVRKLKF